MEILPHIWISYYNDNITNIIKKKNIELIIHLSSTNNYVKKNNLEQIRIPIDYEEDTTYEDKNNTMYNILFDITDFMHEKISKNKKILLIGIYDKQDIDTIIIAYLIRYAKLNINNSIIYLNTKKENIFYPKFLFYDAINKFFNHFK